MIEKYVYKVCSILYSIFFDHLYCLLGLEVLDGVVELLDKSFLCVDTFLRLRWKSASQWHRVFTTGLTHLRVSDLANDHMFPPPEHVFVDVVV